MATASSSATATTRRRVEEAPGSGREDYLMSLPPDMLDNILSRLPFEQLVRTSCLSRAWRRRWESVAGLDIWFSASSAAEPNARVLWRCAAPVLSFTAPVGTRCFHRAARWLRALARKRVERLALDVEDPQFSRSAALLGPAFFSCHALAHLELYGCTHMPRAPPQGFAGFPNLTILVLNRVAFPFIGGAAQLERLISSAPGLEVLWLNDVITSPFHSTVVETCAIRAPNLRILKLIMLFDNGCRVAEELPLLEEATIAIDDLFGTQDYIDTLRRIASVKELSFQGDSNQFDENPLEGISWKFQNLRVATLAVNFAKLPSTMSIFSLLRCAPHIEKLHIEAEKTKRKGDDEVDEDFLSEELSDPESDDEIDEDILNAEISDDMLANLKHISLSGIKYLSNDVCFMKFLLSKAGFLESFVVTFGYRRETEAYVKARGELATCRKASPQAKLRVSLSDKPAPDANDF